MQKLLRKIDIIILGAIALASSIIAIVDFFDLFGGVSPNYPLFILLLLGIIGLHLIISHFSQEDFRSHTTASLQSIVRGIKTADFRVFNDSIEIESYLAKRILEAKKSVCDLSWKVKISEGFSASNRQLAHGYMDKCIAEVSDRIPYREIFMFNDPRRAEKLERRLLEKKRGYSCRYFKDDSPIPRLQFVIIDDEEIFFFASAADSLLCAFRSQELCKVFRSYYEVSWNAAIPIKDGPRIYDEEVELIRKYYCQK